MIEAGEPCEILEWDSTFFGISIARARMARLNRDSCRTMMEWCRTRAIDCLYFLAESGDAETSQLLRDTGFTAVDERVTLERDVRPGVSHPSLSGVRPARPSDVPALRDIAAVSHRDSRFYTDPGFDRRKCDEFYRIWIERSCAGWADSVIVVEREGAPAGYLTLHLRTPGSAAIGLLAVSPSHQRRGVASHLVAGAMEWLGNRSIERVSVVTQGRNAVSLAFYRSAGFEVSTNATWYHRWFERESSAER